MADDVSPIAALQAKVDLMKTESGDFEYYAIGLRDDLACLLATALEKAGVTQRELAARAGYKSESYVSRIMHAETDFKIGVAARLLLPLGVVPKLVDAAEYERLQKASAGGSETCTSDFEQIALHFTNGKQAKVEYGRHQGRSLSRVKSDVDEASVWPSGWKTFDRREPATPNYLDRSGSYVAPEFGRRKRLDVDLCASTAGSD